jgi:acetyl esterase/lipase
MKLLIVAFVLIVNTDMTNAQKLFRIWPGKAPGSESWNWPEGEDTSVWLNDPLAFNVTEPVITFYPANPGTLNGTSVVVCPGGAFYYLHIRTEGSEVAERLSKSGVSVFVLKYRLLRSYTKHPVQEKNEKMKDTANGKLFAALVPLAIGDAKQAVSFVRKHAAEYHIDPKKIGVMGFSAGGTLAVACAFDYTPENRPDFLASIYAYLPPALPMVMMKDEPPIFIAAASDDELHLVPMSINLYNKWLAAGLSAEIHIYSKGGHGFGMNKYNEPSDTWIDRFVDWLGAQGFLKK